MAFFYCNSSQAFRHFDVWTHIFAHQLGIYDKSRDIIHTNVIINGSYIRSQVVLQEYQTIKEEVPTWVRVILNISKSQGSQAKKMMIQKNMSLNLVKACWFLYTTPQQGEFVFEVCSIFMIHFYIFRTIVTKKTDKFCQKMPCNCMKMKVLLQKRFELIVVSHPSWPGFMGSSGLRKNNMT